MALRIAINGFGRIGRCVFRILEEQKRDVEVVHINDITDARTLAHLLKYDSVHGQFRRNVGADGNTIVVGDRRVEISAETDPTKLPWRAKGVDLVLECTGKFTERPGAQKHIDAGAKRVMISAPSKDCDGTFVMGVNHKTYDPVKHHLISNASCTTNCLAPVAKMLNDNFGIVRALMTTIHSYTNDQKVMDMPHKDLRRARAAAVSMIPTTTGAAKAVGLVLPELKGKFDGVAIRVPTPNVSLVDLSAELGKDTTVDEINGVFKAACDNEFKGITDFTLEPVVSVDFNHTSVSGTIDGDMTKVLDKRMAKVFIWYDNEWGYATRMVDLMEHMRKVGV